MVASTDTKFIYRKKVHSMVYILVCVSDTVVVVLPNVEEAEGMDNLGHVNVGLQ